MSRGAGPSTRSILYWRPEQPPPITARRNAPSGRPCFSRSELSRWAAFSVTLISFSLPILIPVRAALAVGSDVASLTNYGRVGCGIFKDSRSPELAQSAPSRSLLNGSRRWLLPRQQLRHAGIFPQCFAFWKTFGVSHETRPHRADGLFFVAPIFGVAPAMLNNDVPPLY